MHGPDARTSYNRFLREWTTEGGVLRGVPVWNKHICAEVLLDQFQRHKLGEANRKYLCDVYN